MPLDLPNKELLDAIKAGAVTAECADPVHATAVAIQAFANGEARVKLIMLDVGVCRGFCMFLPFRACAEPP